jgi:hypothetical protein
MNDEEERYVIDVPTGVITYPEVGLNSWVYLSLSEAEAAAIAWSKSDITAVHIYKLVLIKTINP